MKKFEVIYDVIGSGKCIIDAESKKEATDIFNERPEIYITQNSEDIYRDAAYAEEIVDHESG